MEIKKEDHRNKHKIKNMKGWWRILSGEGNHKVDRR